MSEDKDIEWRVWVDHLTANMLDEAKYLTTLFEEYGSQEDQWRIGELTRQIKALRHGCRLEVEEV